MTPTPEIKIKIKSSPRVRELKDFAFTYDMLPEVKDKSLQAYRQKAWDAYQTLSFPSKKDEAWRRTDIRGLNTEVFNLPLPLEEEEFKLPPTQCVDLISEGEQSAGQIIQGNVQTVRRLDPELEAKGVIFTNFQSAEDDYPELLGKLVDQIVSPAEDKFAALAAALGRDGVLLYVPKNVIIENPLHSLYCGDSKNIAFLNHLLIWVEDGAHVTFVHESVSPHEQFDGQIFHSGIVEIHVGREAQLNFVELQSWGTNVWSFTRERARVLQDGHLEWIFGAMGTHVTKNFSDINLIEPGAYGRMSGFYFSNDTQHLDHDTQQNHLAKNTTSDLLYKGALLDKSRSVWQGMIYVAPGAIGTDGYQANRNLILSKGARADSIPGLEILADDVRCTHGATVGKIDENELFYLLSRGIPKQEAEQLIVTGFFAEIMERIPFEGVKNRFLEAINKKMTE